MASQNSYQEIVTLCQNVVAQHGQPVLGGDYGDELATTIVYDTATLEVGEDKAVISVTRDEVRPPFEWLVEVSTWGKVGVHVLAYPDGRLVEAYGHQLFDVTEENARALVSFIEALA